MFLTKLNPSNRRGTRPVCPVVWEGWHREVSPYPDLCPLAVLHDGHEDRWVDACHLLSEFTKTGQRRVQRGAGHLKDPFERPIELHDQKNRAGDR